MKVLFNLLVAVIGISCFSVQAAGKALPVTAKSVLVMDADTNEVLYEKNSDDIKPIASITKLMTAVVTLEAGLDPYETVTITRDDVRRSRSRSGPTGTSLPVGSKLTRGELLHLTLMNSHNRAAAALARTYPGGFDVFVDQMNLKAIQLGMYNTTYVDPTGLYNTNQSTADDLSLLIQEAAKYPDISTYSTSSTYSPMKSKRVFGTTNRLVVLDDWNIILQKTGYIADAGRCVVMLAEVAYRKVIIVLLGNPSNAHRANDAVAIKYWIEHDEIPSKSIIRSLSPYKPHIRSKVTKKS